MIEVTDKLMVCGDCFAIISTGDVTSFDYYYTESEADKRIEECSAGIARVQADGSLVAGDGANDQEFSWRACECCGTDLGGSRYECMVLSK